jgi:hypothetical protein
MTMEKGSGKAGLYTGIGGFGAEASYAIDSHVVIMADGMYNNFSSLGTNQTYSINAGAGYFLGNTPTDYKDHVLSFEMLGGFGYGYANADISYFRGDLSASTEHDVLKGSYYKFFVQTELVSFHKNSRFAFGLRVCDINVNDFNYNITTSVKRTSPSGPKVYITSNEKQ